MGDDIGIMMFNLFVIVMLVLIFWKLTEGGDAIDVTQITALKGFKNKAQVLDEDQLSDLITQISGQLQEIALTGSAARMNYEEYFNHVSAHFQSSDISNMMIQAEQIQIINENEFLQSKKLPWIT